MSVRRPRTITSRDPNIPLARSARHDFSTKDGVGPPRLIGTAPRKAPTNRVFHPASAPADLISGFGGVGAREAGDGTEIGTEAGI